MEIFKLSKVVVPQLAQIKEIAEVRFGNDHHYHHNHHYHYIHQTLKKYGNEVSRLTHHSKQIAERGTTVLSELQKTLMNVRFNLRLKNLAQTIYLKPKPGQKSYDFSNMNFKDVNSVKTTLKSNLETFVERVRDEIASADQQTNNGDSTKTSDSSEKSATHQVVTGSNFIKEEVVPARTISTGKTIRWDNNALLEQHSMFVESLQPEVVEDQTLQQPKYLRTYFYISVRITSPPFVIFSF